MKDSKTLKISIEEFNKQPELYLKTLGSRSVAVVRSNGTVLMTIGGLVDLQSASLDDPHPNCSERTLSA